MDMEITEISTGRQILKNDTGMPDMVIAKLGDTFLLYESEADFDKGKSLRMYSTLAEVKAFVNGVYWTCVKRL